MALDQTLTDKYAAYHGDCTEVVRHIPDSSIDFAIYSPPFSNLFVYSDSERDMGNAADDAEFFRHYTFLIEEMARIMRPGRIVAVHVSDLPSFKERHGEIGLRDFSGEVIRAHQKAGFVYHSRVTVWKDPVVEMQRTKALGLLHKQILKDSTKSRMGLPDYVLAFRAPGVNDDPVSHERSEFSVDQWQKWASPVWMDIVQGNVLDKRQARDPKDEKHIVPLQLDLIERCMVLWSNEADIVFSPFMGIGSEGVVALRNRRKFVGVELKDTYYRQAVRHLDEADRASAFGDLLSRAS